jgi:hypothetical protein
MHLEEWKLRANLPGVAPKSGRLTIHGLGLMLGRRHTPHELLVSGPQTGTPCSCPCRSRYRLRCASHKQCDGQVSHRPERLATSTSRHRRLPIKRKLCYRYSWLVRVAHTCRGLYVQHYWSQRCFLPSLNPSLQAFSHESKRLGSHFVRSRRQTANQENAVLVCFDLQRSGLTVPTIASGISKPAASTRVPEMLPDPSCAAALTIPNTKMHTQLRRCDS